jgi:arsenate reductase-like glutaredoxin family protein
MILFSKPHCEKCEDIKALLKKNNITFIEKSIADPTVVTEIRPLLAGLKNPLMPIIQFDDGAVVSNDMGLYKELRNRGLVTIR